LPEKRHERELQVITPLLSKIEFFEKRDFHQLELEEIARNIKYEYKEPGDIIYDSLEDSKKMYICLKGKVMV
jgi:hypothetical protein